MYTCTLYYAYIHYVMCHYSHAEYTELVYAREIPRCCPRGRPIVATGTYNIMQQKQLYRSDLVEIEYPSE